MRYRIVYWLYFYLIFHFALPGQGLVFDNDDYNRLPRQSHYGDGSKSELKVLDSVPKIDLKSFCPKVQHQGQVGSCVGWSVGYGAYTIQRAINNNWGGNRNLITQNAYSAMFIFDQIKITDCDYGSRIGDALKLLKEKGDVYSKDFDNDKSDCFKLPADKELKLAYQHRIKDFMTLFGPDDKQLIKVNKTKLSLLQDMPVCVGMDLKKNFQNIKHGEKFWFPEVGDTNPFGGHAMVVIGYDDGKKAFELMNSWGELWGNNGFIWIKYDDFAKYCRYGFQFYLSDAEDIRQICHGKLILRRPVLRTKDTILFKQEEVVLNQDFYSLKRSSLELGTRFQLVLNQISPGTYIYVISFDPKQKIKIHWPRDEKLDEKFTGMHESALITVSTIKLVIPGTYSALELNQTGEEFICVLISKSPIFDFSEKLKALGEYKGTIPEKLKKIFKNRMVPRKMVKYKKNNLEFSSELKSNQIVPLYLKVEVQ
jgi:hypothetical protein